MFRKKFFYNTFCDFFLLLLLLSFTSCSINMGNDKDNKGDHNMTLNERQISICEDLGLATDYDDLDIKQQILINRIENLLEYLDQKYDTKFNFLGYNEPILQSEKLKAYSDEFSEYEYTTLIVKDDGTFEDDYIFQFVKQIVRKDFTEYLQENLNNSVKIYVTGGKTDIKDVSKIKKDTLSETTQVCCTVFIQENENINTVKIKDTISDWYKKLGVYGNTNVIAVNREAFDSITYENYSSIKRKYNLTNLILCEVSSSGSVKVY